MLGTLAASILKKFYSKGLMTAKRNNHLLTLIACLIIAAAISFAIGCKGTDKKQELSQLIYQLEKYKLKHGSYPLNLDSISIRVDDDVHYSVDSTRHNFNLAYTEGAMDVNTVSYSSKTQKWEKRFNY